MRQTKTTILTGRTGKTNLDAGAGVATPTFFVSVHSIGDEILCFDADLEVFILLGLEGLAVYRVVTF
jgi:hypothetical protein